MGREIVDTKNILDLSNVDSWDLMKELKSRGYYTQLIYSPSDVDMLLDTINDNRDEENGDIIVLCKEDKETILQDCFNTDWYCERMNDDVVEHILDNYDDETYYKKIDNVDDNS
jgi:hypothetical protein